MLQRLGDLILVFMREIDICQSFLFSLSEAFLLSSLRLLFRQSGLGLRELGLSFPANWFCGKN